MNLYTVRSSCFTIKVRPAGLDSEGREYEWGALNNQFVVTGRRPVDVYNYIRFEFPQAKSRYEFRLSRCLARRLLMRLAARRSLSN